MSPLKQPPHPVPTAEPVRDTALGMPATLRARQLDRQARLLLRALRPYVGRGIGPGEVAYFRRSWRTLALAVGRLVDLASVVDKEFAGPDGPVAVRIYTPLGAPGPRPAFLWCHGGGFVVGDLDSNDSVCARIARGSGAVVVAVRYRLAPEHDLYAGREDFLAALNWVASHGAEIGIDPARLAIGGDSAGGNIAAAVAQENRRRGGPDIAMQVLAYPATDLEADFPSKEENGRGYFMTAEFMDSLKPLIVQGRDLTDPWLSPAYSTDLAGLPPAVIVTAGYDPIRDDGLTYAARLRAAGVPVELLHYPGEFHGYLNFSSVDVAARDVLWRIGLALAHGLCEARPPANRTLEIYDATAQDPFPMVSRLRRDWFMGALMMDRSLRQLYWNQMDWIFPGSRQIAATAWQPWRDSLHDARRALVGHLASMTEREVYNQPVQ